VTTEPAPPGAEARVPDEQAPPNPFARVGAWNYVAFLAALALLLAMSIDWYTTKEGEDARRVQHLSQENLGQNPRTVKRDAANAAEKEEKNAWQADAFVDRLILLTLLIAAGAAALAAFLRAAGRRVAPSPTAIASLAGTLGAFGIVYRMVQQPGLNAASVVKVGAPLSLLAVGVLAVAARWSVLSDRERSEPLS
jgi:hypothetical protein